MTASTFHKWAERIGRFVPGYTGYAQRADIRSADKVFRMGVGRLLREAVKAIESHQATLVRGDNSMEAVQADEIRKRVELLADRVEVGRYGASGLFAAQEVGAAELDRIHEMDLEIATAASAILTHAGAHLADSTLAWPALTQACTDLDKALQVRDTFIQQHK